MNRTTGEYATHDVEEGGVELKYGITSNLTFDFTYNPDFSQIESDRQQIEVNQRFPVHYPELRPFFLEGREIYQVASPGGATIIHTRTIVDPRYGAKLTGKLGKTSVGVFVADDEAPGKVDPADPAFGKTAQTMLGRAALRLTPGRTSACSSPIGSSSTATAVSAASTAAGRSAGTIGSRTRHLRLAGEIYKAWITPASWPKLVFAKEGGRFGYRSQSHLVDPDFSTDVGFVRRTDQRGTRGGASYRWYPESWIVNWGPTLSYDYLWDYESILQERGMTPRSTCSLRRTSAPAEVSSRAWSDSAASISRRSGSR